ncbi:MAG TPA: peptidylprolyl isomerase [Candidatus Woesearchaeota archaeon]|nr:peptidylprolyl isomerase [Candidatus Woesearchaeota archaeon]
MKIEGKKKVTLDYTAMQEDGTVFDTSEGYAPLKIITNANNIVPGFEKNIAGMQEGEEKEFTVAPEEGYGERIEELIKTVEKSKVPGSEKLKEGVYIQFMSPEGYPVIALIKKIEDDKITFDMNHPLAGKTVKFKVKIVKVEEPTPEELQHGHVHHERSHSHAKEQQKANENVKTDKKNDCDCDDDCECECTEEEKKEGKENCDCKCKDKKD